MPLICCVTAGWSLHGPGPVFFFHKGMRGSHLHVEPREAASTTLIQRSGPCPPVASRPWKGSHEQERRLLRGLALQALRGPASPSFSASPAIPHICLCISMGLEGSSGPQRASRHLLRKELRKLQADTRVDNAGSFQIFLTPQLTLFHFDWKSISLQGSAVKCFNQASQAHSQGHPV